MASRSAAARALGLSRDALARMEERGLAHAQRDAHGKPVYSEIEIARLAQALRSGSLVAPGRSVDVAATEVVQPAANTSTAKVAQQTAAAAAPPVNVIVRDDNNELRALQIAAERERLESARLTAEIERLRAQAQRDDVARALRERLHKQHVGEIVGRAMARVGEHDQELAEQLLRERLDVVLDLDRAWMEVAVITRNAVEDAKRRGDQERRASAQRVAEFQRGQREAAQRAAADRAAQAAAEAAQQAARAVQEREAQAISTARAQAAAIAQQRAQVRAAQITQAIVAEAMVQRAEPSVVDAAWRASSAALSEMPVDVDDVTAWSYARAAAVHAAAWTRAMLEQQAAWQHEIERQHRGVGSDLDRARDRRGMRRRRLRW